MIYQHEGDSRCRPVQTDTMNDISAGLNLGQGEIGSCCSSRFVLPKLPLDRAYKEDENVRDVSRLDEKILNDGIFSPGHFDRPLPGFGTAAGGAAGRKNGIRAVVGVRARATPAEIKFVSPRIYEREREREREREIWSRRRRLRLLIFIWYVTSTRCALQLAVASVYAGEYGAARAGAAFAGNDSMFLPLSPVPRAPPPTLSTALPLFRTTSAAVMPAANAREKLTQASPYGRARCIDRLLRCTSSTLAREPHPTTTLRNPAAHPLPPTKPSRNPLRLHLATTTTGARLRTRSRVKLTNPLEHLRATPFLTGASPPRYRAVITVFFVTSDGSGADAATTRRIGAFVVLRLTRPITHRLLKTYTAVRNAVPARCCCEPRPRTLRSFRVTDIEKIWLPPHTQKPLRHPDGWLR
ncbi:hypothetical protein ALC62_04209 [Cyphomyrmex costatus]|uniref:Uncharacterized protein n=1 Tax=Cyphomyrmex costatus TaxID=456900 RepID=A0A195CW16_9HYME|nr:hypothetical protein ALC62_04209 [Cyphomyrmex costatus]